MSSLVFKMFDVMFRLVAVLLVTGVMASVLVDLQARAFKNSRHGLVSMLSVNQQLVGKTHR